MYNYIKFGLGTNLAHIDPKYGLYPLKITGAICTFK